VRDVPVNGYLALTPVGISATGKSFTHEFRWTNETSQPIQIRSIKPSCDCVQVTEIPRVIAAGSVGRITISVMPKITGPIDWLLFAEVEGGERPQLFGLSGTVGDLHAEATPKNLLVQAVELMKKNTNSQDVTFLDVRSQDEFRLSHIPGSINLPPFTIKGMGFLRLKRLVLLNQGYSNDELIKEAGRLGKMQFSSIEVLDGGLRAWQLAGGAVEGENLNSPALATITSQQFFSARSEPGWLVIAIQKIDASAFAGLLQASYTLDGESAILVEWITGVIKQYPAARRILLTSADGTDYSKLQVIMHELHDLPVFFLQGGAQAYNAYFGAQFSMQERREVTLASESKIKFSNGPRSAGKSSCCGGK